MWGAGELECLYSQNSVRGHPRGTGIPRHCGWGRGGMGWDGVRVSGHLRAASERDAVLALESGHVLGAPCKKMFKGWEGIRQGTGKRDLERMELAGLGPSGSRAGTGHRLATQRAQLQA